jgi:hypothetical protein
MQSDVCTWCVYAKMQATCRAKTATAATRRSFRHLCVCACARMFQLYIINLYEMRVAHFGARPYIMLVDIS